MMIYLFARAPVRPCIFTISCVVCRLSKSNSHTSTAAPRTVRTRLRALRSLSLSLSLHRRRHQTPHTVLTHCSCSTAASLRRCRRGPLPTRPMARVPPLRPTATRRGRVRGSIASRAEGATASSSTARPTMAGQGAPAAARGRATAPDWQCDAPLQAAARRPRRHTCGRWKSDYRPVETCPAALGRERSHSVEQHPVETCPAALGREVVHTREAPAQVPEGRER